MERFEAERVQREANNLELRKDAETEAAKMQDLTVSMVRQHQKWGNYSVRLSRDIAEAVTEAGFYHAQSGDYGSLNQNAGLDRTRFVFIPRCRHSYREYCSLTCRSRNPAQDRVAVTGEIVDDYSMNFEVKTASRMHPSG